MKITIGTPLPGRETYWIVSVDKGEVHVKDGRPVQSGRVGEILSTGHVEVTYPGVVPRGYNEAVMKVLEKARAKLGFSWHGGKWVKRKHRY